VLQKELIRDSFVPDLEIQQMRQYNRRRFALVRNLQRAEQALDMVLQRCNIRLSNYVSDIGGKPMKKVLNASAKGRPIRTS
jgi:transposase